MILCEIRSRKGQRRFNVSRRLDFGRVDSGAFRWRCRSLLRKTSFALDGDALCSGQSSLCGFISGGSCFESFEVGLCKILDAVEASEVDLQDSFGDTKWS